MIKVKRVYDDPAEDDGYRILVDRLWPRGLSKERARIDLWLREIAPSNELRKWFHRDREARWEEFKKRYWEELRHKKHLIELIKRLEAEKGTITLLYASKDRNHNNAVALLELLTRETRGATPSAKQQPT